MRSRGQQERGLGADYRPNVPEQHCCFPVGHLATETQIQKVRGTGTSPGQVGAGAMRRGLALGRPACWSNVPAAVPHYIRDTGCRAAGVSTPTRRWLPLGLAAQPLLQANVSRVQRPDRGAHIPTNPALEASFFPPRNVWRLRGNFTAVLKSSLLSFQAGCFKKTEKQKLRMHVHAHVHSSTIRRSPKRMQPEPAARGTEKQIMVPPCSAWKRRDISTLLQPEDREDLVLSGRSQLQKGDVSDLQRQKARRGLPGAREGTGCSRSTAQFPFYKVRKLCGWAVATTELYGHKEQKQYIPHSVHSTTAHRMFHKAKLNHKGEGRLMSTFYH